MDSIQFQNLQAPQVQYLWQQALESFTTRAAAYKIAYMPCIYVLLTSVHYIYYGGILNAIY